MQLGGNVCGAVGVSVIVFVILSVILCVIPLVSPERLKPETSNYVRL